MKHPSWEQWLTFVSGDETSELAVHLEACGECSREVELIRRLQSAGAVGSLVSPPDALLDEIESQTASMRPVANAQTEEQVEWELADVRGAQTASPGEPVFLARSLPGVQLSVLVTAPQAERRWRLQGQVWVDRGGDRPIRVVLAHADHVLCELQTRDGDQFTIDEVSDHGWKLEIHLADDRTLVIEDPFA